MRKLAQLVASSLSICVLALAAHASPAQQQSKGAPNQQARPLFKGARVVPAPQQQSVVEIYQHLMKQQPQQQASQSK